MSKNLGDIPRALAGSVCAAALLVSHAAPVMAADHWLSGVRLSDGSRLSASSFVQEGARLASSALASTSATAVFDLTISLVENPQGDDVYPADSGANDDPQNAFEARIEEFADAVFQATNGAHKIGKVTVFRDGKQSTLADVRWDENCGTAAVPDGPYAHPSTYGVSGGYIHMCTNWTGSSSMSTPKGSGYTLAHEWGHYVYGLYDEYAEPQCTTPMLVNCGPAPKASDTEANPSIMNDQWQAVSNPNYLEFSTQNIAPFDGSSGTNAQKRVFGESGWQTLVRDPATDPRHSYLPNRTQYTTLSAPTAPNWIVNDNEADARSELDIVWAGDQVVELMIDDSGSMGGTPIANAKTAGNLLVDQLIPGSTAVGIGRFDGSASQAYPITDIPDPDTGVRQAAKAAINGLLAGGGTDIQSAAILAVNQTQAFQGGQRPSIVYLLTDGRSSVNVPGVVQAYQNAGVPLITFGFGPNVDVPLLTALANGTGGAFFNSPTTLAQIQQAFITANAAFSANVLVSSSAVAASSSSPTRQTIPLDSTLATASITATYAGPASDVALALLLPDGSDSGVVFNCDGTSEISCSGDVDVAASGAGNYTLQVTYSGSDPQKPVDILVGAAPSEFSPYDIAVDFDDANYPASFTLAATVTKGPSISGLDVQATITKPDNTTMDVVLVDDGSGSDLMADDGTYTADLAYESDGLYSAVVRASNAAGTAMTTFNGIALALREDGTAMVPSPTAITENFTRTGGGTAQVAGLQADDHTNDPTVPGACTTVSDDNIDTNGRIDAAGDVDCLFFTPTSTTEDLVVRVTGLALGMDPVVTVYGPNGTTELASFDLSTSENPSSGAVATVPASALDAAGHVVTVAHSDATATAGNYALSVGAALVSDTEEASGSVVLPTDGGALGPWSLLLTSFLALIGLRQRRRRV